MHGPRLGTHSQSNRSVRGVWTTRPKKSRLRTYRGVQLPWAAAISLALLANKEWSMLTGSESKLHSIFSSRYFRWLSW